MFVSVTKLLLQDFNTTELNTYVYIGSFSSSNSYEQKQSDMSVYQIMPPHPTEITSSSLGNGGAVSLNAKGSLCTIYTYILHL